MTDEEFFTALALPSDIRLGSLRIRNHPSFQPSQRWEVFLIFNPDSSLAWFHQHGWGATLREAVDDGVQRLRAKGEAELKARAERRAKWEAEQAKLKEIELDFGDLL